VLAVNVSDFLSLNFSTSLFAKEGRNASGSRERRFLLSCPIYIGQVVGSLVTEDGELYALGAFGCGGFGMT
jgi:hypothetical protein